MQLWRTVLLTPFKLITVFMHEASHAIACILTCGKVRDSFPLLTVEGIQVHANEGGVTYWFFILGNAVDTCIHQSSYCKNCCWLFGSCSPRCAFYCQELDSLRTLYRIHCVPCCHLGATRIHESEDPPIRYSLHRYSHFFSSLLVKLLKVN
ncbi:hypothetical protein LINGRAHAP2_LOCUS28031 [Linum grandiflorum]